MSRRIALTIAASILAIGSAIPTYASPPAVTIELVYDLINGGIIDGASSRIIRTDNGVTVNIDTSVDPGTYTMWFLVWNSPENSQGLPGLPLVCAPPIDVPTA